MSTTDTMIRKAFDATIDGDAGGFSGYANPFGKLDSVGDITMPGAFADAIGGFLTHGFIPDNHEWERRLAYPIAAYEDAHGLFITARFHTTQRGQDARTEAIERMAAGLSERLSIGFTLAEFEFVTGAEAVRYLIDPTPEEVDRCASMARVRLIHKVKQLFEVSLVSVPAAAGSDVTLVKAAGSPAGVVADAVTDAAAEAKGIHLGDMVEEGAAIFVIENLIQRLMWRVVYDVLYSGGDTPTQAKLDIISEAITELHDEVIRIVGALLASADDMTEAKADLDALLSKSTVAPPAERKVSAECDDALAAVTALHTRLADIHALRTKAGRRISRATRELLEPHPAALRAAADNIDLLLAEDDASAAGEQANVIGSEKSADATDAVTTGETAITAATDAAADPEFIDPEIANGIVAQFIITHGPITND